MKIQIQWAPEKKKAKKPFTVGDLAVGEIGRVDNRIDDEDGDDYSYYLRVSSQGIINLDHLMSGPVVAAIWREECTKLEHGSLSLEIEL